MTDPDWKKNIVKAFEATKTTPEWKAMEKLSVGIAALRADPEIAASEVCTDLLDTLHELLERAWPHYNIGEIVSPMQAHFDGIRARIAINAKKKKRDEDRNNYDNFLDIQKDIADTKLLAARLRRQFGINSQRVSEDEVRRWKKLRATSKT